MLLGVLPLLRAASRTGNQIEVTECRTVSRILDFSEIVSDDGIYKTVLVFDR